MLAGDADAFRTIIDSYQSYLYRLALSVLHHPKDAEDAAQEAFVKIYFSLASYQGQGFKTWISRIMVNTAIDLKRRQGRRMESALPIAPERVELAAIHAAVSESVEHDLLRRERAQLIAHYLNEIPDHFRQVVVAFYMEEKSHQQIALEHSIAVKTVESRLYRARQWMREHWSEEDLQ